MPLLCTDIEGQRISAFSGNIVTQAYLHEEGIPLITNELLPFSEDNVRKIMEHEVPTETHPGQRWILVGVRLCEAKQTRLAGYFLFLCEPDFSSMEPGQCHKSQCELFAAHRFDELVDDVAWSHCYAAACLEGLICWSFSVGPATYEAIFPPIHFVSAFSRPAPLIVDQDSVTLGMPIPASDFDIPDRTASAAHNSSQSVFQTLSGAGDVIRHVQDRSEKDGYALSRGDSSNGVYFVSRLSTTNGLLSAHGNLSFSYARMAEDKEPRFHPFCLNEKAISSHSQPVAMQLWSLAAERLRAAGVKVNKEGFQGLPLSEYPEDQQWKMQQAMGKAAPILPRSYPGMPIPLNATGLQHVRSLSTGEELKSLLKKCGKLGEGPLEYQPTGGQHPATAMFILYDTHSGSHLYHGFVLVSAPHALQPLDPLRLQGYRFFEHVPPPVHRLALRTALLAVTARLEQLQGWKGLLVLSQELARNDKVLADELWTETVHGLAFVHKRTAV
jgi:hypothetical protein